MLQRLWQIIDTRLIMPFRESYAPVEEVARGTVVGFIWCMTPLVGVQMYLVFVTWLLAKAVRIRFSMPIAIALVWITNPVTMPFFYYAFYETGRILLQFQTYLLVEPITIERIEQLVTAADNKSLIDGLVYWFQTFLRDFGIPSIIGGFVWGIVCSVFGYPYTIRFMNRHRSKLAAKEGISLAEWEARHVQRFSDAVKKSKQEHELPVYAKEHFEASPDAVSRSFLAAQEPKETTTPSPKVTKTKAAKTQAIKTKQPSKKVSKKAHKKTTKKSA